MNKPIQVGDLVMVIRGRVCCGYITPQTGSAIFKVVGFRNVDGICSYCNAENSNLVNALGEGMDKGYDIRRLKRLDPDALKDETPTREELHA